MGVGVFGCLCLHDQSLEHMQGGGGGGEPGTCLILQLIKGTRDSSPPTHPQCVRKRGPRINTSLFSRQEKQEERQTGGGGDMT